MDPSTLTTGTFTLSSAGGAVPGSVAYDPASNTATFVPAAALSPLTTYTVQVAGARGADETPVSTFSWGFTTVAGPTITSVTPADGTSYAQRGTAVTATFSRAMDPTSITTSTFQLYAPDGSVVPATVSYNATSLTATLTPSAQLLGNSTYAASMSGTVRASDGTPLGSSTVWKFTTSTCPCSLFSIAQVPAKVSLPTRDGRSGTGPWSYELGVKFRVDEPMRLNGIRFYKSPGETGTHVVNLWTTTGLQLASATVASETASGWQEGTFASPPLLQAGTTYVASVNANSYFGETPGGLTTQVVSGPLRSVADGSNGVYGSSAGVFPGQTYQSTNYFTDVDVVPDSTATPPTVTSTFPVANQQNVDANLPITATFSRPMNPSTITATSFSVRQAGQTGGADSGGAVDATVTYNDATNTATLTPTAALAHGDQYTVTLSGSAIRAQDGMPLGSDVSWTFAVGSPPPPLAVVASPGNGATAVDTDAPIKLTYNRSVDPSTLTSSTTQLVGPSGAVPATITYNATSFTETIQPTAKLATNTTYTINVTTGVLAPDGTSMLNPYSSSFTTGTCPCILMTGLVPKSVNNPVQDGRTGTGPWSYELGTKIILDQPAQLASIRFWKDSKETGSHTARVWSASGQLLATLPFTSETSGGGWQQADFASPLPLAANTVYIVSVNANAYFSTIRSGLTTALTSGIAHTVADGKNGVYGSAAGVFPTLSFSSTNYLVDVVIR
jgi:hypothetical protein